MRKLWSLLAAGALVLSMTSSAQAAVMSWTGTMNIQLGALPPLIVTGFTGPGGAIVNGSGGGAHLTTLVLNQSNGVIAGQATVPLTDPLNPTLLSLRGSFAVGSGVLRPISGAAASAGPLTMNTLPVTGVFKLCILFPGCQFFIPIPLTVNGTKGMGIGGLITVGGFAKTGIKISVNAAPWTIKTATIMLPTANGMNITTETAMGFAHGPASLTSSTALASGVVQLVTPILVQTSLGSNPYIALFGTLTVHLTPEPGTLLLFGSGIAAMGIAARRRSKK